MSAPKIVYQKGSIKAAIFENEYNGKKMQSIKLSKSYKDKDDKWQNTDFFNVQDLDNLSTIINTLAQKQVKTFDPASKKQSSNELPADAFIGNDPGSEDIPF